MYQVYIQYFTFSFVLNSLPIPQFRLLRFTAVPPTPSPEREGEYKRFIISVLSASPSGEGFRVRFSAPEVFSAASY